MLADLVLRLCILSPQFTAAISQPASRIRHCIRRRRRHHQARTLPATYWSESCHKADPPASNQPRLLAPSTRSSRATRRVTGSSVRRSWRKSLRGGGGVNVFAARAHCASQTFLSSFHSRSCSSHAGGSQLPQIHAALDRHRPLQNGTFSSFSLVHLLLKPSPQATHPHARPPLGTLQDSSYLLNPNSTSSCRPIPLTLAIASLAPSSLT